MSLTVLEEVTGNRWQMIIAYDRLEWEMALMNLSTTKNLP